MNEINRDRIKEWLWECEQRKKRGQWAAPLLSIGEFRRLLEMAEKVLKIERIGRAGWDDFDKELEERGK